MTMMAVQAPQRMSCSAFAWPGMPFVNIFVDTANLLLYVVRSGSGKKTSKRKRSGGAKSSKASSIKDKDKKKKKKKGDKKKDKKKDKKNKRLEDDSSDDAPSHWICLSVVTWLLLALQVFWLETCVHDVGLR